MRSTKGFLIGGFVISLALFFCCRSPVTSDRSRQTIRLSFHVSGIPSEVRAGSSGARLLLPSATCLNVTLTPNEAGLSPETVLPEIPMSDSQTSYEAIFTDIIVGSYTIKAEACDAADTVLFRQSVNLSLGASGSTVSLNLLPVQMSPTCTISPVTTLQSPDSLIIDAGQSVSLAVPMEALIEGSFYSFQLTSYSGDGDVLLFAQDSQGMQLNPVNSTVLDFQVLPLTVSVSDGSVSYLTFYNSATTGSATVAFAINSFSLVLGPNGADSAPSPVQALTGGQSYQASVPIATVTSLGWTKSNARFDGWNTSADGSGTAIPASTGSRTLAEPAETLYAQWKEVDFTQATVTIGVQSWSSISMSADGSRIAAGGVFVSSDQGLTWTERSVPGATGWCSIASSADGTRLAATFNPGNIYTSSDSGATWALYSSTGFWYSIASSADGSRLVAVRQSSGVYCSADYGASWSGPYIGSYDYTHTASSSDGKYLAATASGANIWTSQDYGATWTDRTGGSLGSRSWSSIATSADGSHLVAAIWGGTGTIWTSADYGATWTQRTSAGSGDWVAAASSGDGSRLIATIKNGYIYNSDDYGVTWTAYTAAGSRDWGAVAMSADGTEFAAIYSGGGFCRGE